MLAIHKTSFSLQIKTLESKYAGARTESRDTERKLKNQLDLLQRKLTVAEKELMTTRIELTTCQTKLAETKHQLDQIITSQRSSDGEMPSRLGKRTKSVIASLFARRIWVTGSVFE